MKYIRVNIFSVLLRPPETRDDHLPAPDPAHLSQHQDLHRLQEQQAEVVLTSALNKTVAVAGLFR